jgi:serine phosphatase RsbU (regulator of sigma subunit)/AmiR/NasT family two-component response regulator
MDNNSPLRIVVADDQPLIRSGLSAFLLIFSEMQLVGEAQDGEEAVQLCELVEPDVLIMDQDIPRLNGLSAARMIHSRWPRIKVLLLGDSKDQSAFQNALEAGAAGYLTKDIAADDLRNAIHQMSEQGSLAFQESSPKILEELAEIALEETNVSVRPSLAQELAAAGKIQAELIPARAPALRGWDIASRLEPARETSGDFFDFIPLPNGDWAVVIADVTDKGMGAALFMTLCSTLIRTYAVQYPLLPAIVMGTVNDRLQSDTRGDMFVTAFYGVLEPDTGRLRYVNAGHNPPIQVQCRKNRPVEQLRPTGMVLGIMENAHWSQKMARFQPGDLLVLYTDGVTEAQDPHGRFFGVERLVQMVRALQGRPSQEILEALLEEVHCFTGSQVLQDDLALIVIARK